MPLTDAVLWVAIMGTAIWASHWLWSVLGVAIASQGLIANTSALMFTSLRLSGVDLAVSTLAAAGVGVALGLAHLALLKSTSKEVLLVASVLLTFLWSDLWLSVPTLTGGSGGLLLGSNPWSVWWACTGLAGAGLACWYMDRHLLPRSDTDFCRLASLELGLQAGVLGVPVSRIFGGGFALAGGVFGLLGAAAVQVTGVLTPTLFTTSWALSVLAVAIAPGLAMLHRVISLPLLFIALRWLLRDQLPPSIGASQFVEFLFPAAVLVWSRARHTLPRIKD